MATSSPPLLVDLFLRTVQASRQAVVTDFFINTKDYRAGKWNALDIYSVDPDTFRRGVFAALDRDPANLSANRVAAWLESRDGNFSSAFNRLKIIAPSLPITADERRELMRLALLDLSLLSDDLLEFAFPALTSDLAVSSYRYQFSRARQTSDWKAYRDSLEESFRVCGRNIFSSVLESGGDAATGSAIREILSMIEGAQRIALVGNGPSLRGSGRGKEIERYDLVIRCNFPKIDGFAEDVGTRTDLVFFTEALFRLLPSYIARDKSYSSARLLTLSNPAAAAGINPDDFTAGLGRTVARLPKSVLDAIEGCSYRHSTTGAHAYILLSGLLRKQVTLFGFDFYSGKELHYFSQSAGLWLAHEVQYEKFFFSEVVQPVLGTFRR